MGGVIVIKSGPQNNIPLIVYSFRKYNPKQVKHISSNLYKGSKFYIAPLTYFYFFLGFAQKRLKKVKYTPLSGHSIACANI